MPPALSNQERAHIASLQQIYQDFQTEMAKLEARQNTLINSIIARVDHAKTQQILEQLKQS